MLVNTKVAEDGVRVNCNSETCSNVIGYLDDNQLTVLLSGYRQCIMRHISTTTENQNNGLMHIETTTHLIESQGDENTSEPSCLQCGTVPASYEDISVPDTEEFINAIFNAEESIDLSADSPIMNDTFLPILCDEVEEMSFSEDELHEIDENMDNIITDILRRQACSLDAFLDEVSFDFSYDESLFD